MSLCNCGINYCSESSNNGRYDQECVKGNAVKPDYTLLPWQGLKYVVDVFISGLKTNNRKRGDWQKYDIVEGIEVYKKALLRHAVAIAGGETVDKSGCTHVAHVVANGLIILWYMARGQK